MNTPRRIISGVAALGLAAAGVVWAGGTAYATTPPDTGCPAGFQVLSLTFLASQGPYHQPFVLDREGNGDGYVCGRAIVDVATQHVCGSPCIVPVLYNFLENDLTPAH